MRDKLSLNTKKQISNFSCLADLLNDLFNIVFDEKTGKKKPLKLLNAHKNSLVQLPINTKIAFEDLEALSKKALDSDSELKMMIELLVASANCRHSQVRKEILTFACNTVNSITFLNPTNDSNIFLLKDIADSNSGYLSRLIMQLKSRFEKYKGDNYKPAQKKNLESNVLAIAHIWAFETGKADIEITLNSFNQFLTDRTNTSFNRSVEIEADERAKIGMVYFLASQTNSPLLNDFSCTLSYFKAGQEAARTELFNTKRALSNLQDKINLLESDNQRLVSETQQKDTLIRQLKDEIGTLTEKHSENEQSLKAQKVHLKDDTSKAKAKALNFLEEEVLSTLQNTLKALDRETPKVHIAVHQVEVMLERVQEEVQWFKK